MVIMVEHKYIVSAQSLSRTSMLTMGVILKRVLCAEGSSHLWGDPCMLEPLQKAT